MVLSIAPLRFIYASQWLVIHGWGRGFLPRRKIVKFGMEAGFRKPYFEPFYDDLYLDRIGKAPKSTLPENVTVFRLCEFVGVKIFYKK